MERISLNKNLSISRIIYGMWRLGDDPNTQPGHVQKADKVDFYDLVRVIDSTSLCPDCKCIRTSRSRHCAVCN